MAYQPLPGPVLGKTSHVTSGVMPVTLMTADTTYLIFATRVIDGNTANIAFAQLAVSIQTYNLRAIEFFISVAVTEDPPAGISGDPLVFAPVDPQSRIEVAFANGSQEVTGGLMLGGRYVPGNDERSLDNPTAISDALGGQPLPPPGLTACYCVRSDQNNAQVTVRQSFREITVDNDGVPVERGIPGT